MFDNEKPRNYMLFAMLATALFSIPLGVVAVVYANKVYPLWNVGNYEEAQKVARLAKIWAWASVVTSIMVGIVMEIITNYGVWS